MSRLSKAAYVFTDVDFVLNSRRTLVAFGDYLGFDEVAVHLLNRLCEAVDKYGFETRIVISSSWRLAHSDVEWWRSKLGARVEGLTPDLKGVHSRGQECETYLDTNYDVYAPWVALDDMSIGEAHSDRWVQVDGNIGLTHTDIDVAYHKLTGESLLPEGFDDFSKWDGLRKWRRKMGYDTKAKN